MKVLVMKLLVVVVAITLTTKMDANATIKKHQNIVGKTDKYINTEPLKLTLNNGELKQTTRFTAEERKVHVIVDDIQPSTTASAEINIYSLDGIDVLGPYTLTEGEELVVEIDEREWGIDELSSTQNANISYWITE